MEAVCIEAFTPDVRRQIFKQFKFDESDWQDLGGFESFIFAHYQDRLILRITHVSHRSLQDIDAEIEFLEFLSNRGASVAKPLKLPGGKQVVQVDEFICSLFSLIPGKVVEESDWQSTLFTDWGRAIGQFHQLATEFTPTKPKRFDWQSDENLNFRNRLPESEQAIVEIGDIYLDKLPSLPQTQDVYGLIHSDAHPGNFLFDDGKLTFIDFDDACYQWFVFDVSTILFSAVLQPWIEGDPDVQVQAAKNFLPHFLDGYDQSFPVTDFLIDNLPLFLKLRELSLYAVIHSHMDVNNLEDWYPKKFMHLRKEGLLADAPYLDMSFR